MVSLPRPDGTPGNSLCTGPCAFAAGQCFSKHCRETYQARQPRSYTVRTVGNDTRSGFPEGSWALAFPRQQRPRTRSALLVIIAVVAGPMSLRAGVSITEYPIPMAGGNYPVDITLGPDGALWFTQNESNKIGRITTAGVITEYPTSSPVLNVNVVRHHGRSGRGAVVYRTAWHRADHYKRSHH